MRIDGMRKRRVVNFDRDAIAVSHLRRKFYLFKNLCQRYSQNVLAKFASGGGQRFVTLLFVGTGCAVQECS